MKNTIRIVLLLFISISFLSACTDLEEEVLDSALGEGLLSEPQAAQGILAPVYANLDGLFNNQEQYFLLQEVTTDEAIVPFRGGTDWFNGGRLIEMHQHTWTPDHNNIRGVWASLVQGVAKSVIAETTLANLESSSSELYIAEARGMGAFYNSLLLDLYGVAFDKGPQDEPGTLSTVLRGQEAIDFIVSELDDIESVLEDHGTLGSSRFTKAAAWGIKAKLLLNKAVYTDRYSPSFDFAQSDMQAVIALCDQIMGSGFYDLERSDYFAIFNVDNHNHPEHILSLDQRLEANGTNRFGWFTLSRNTHGSVQFPASVGTDGASTTSDFYHTWDDNQSDPRFFQDNLPESGTIMDNEFSLDRGFLQGQQYGIVLNESGATFKRDASGNLLIEMLINTAKTGEPVNYSIDVDFENNTGHSDGVRVHKYEFDPMSQDGKAQSRVDIPLIRLGDILLIRAEAKLRSNDTPGALADVNELRSARGASLLTSIDLDQLYNERGFELYWEMHRRTDMIRFGKFGDTWTSKTSDDVNRRLFPIPQSAIDAASGTPGYLEQNEGY